MYAVKSFCEIALSNMKSDDINSMRNIFLAYALSGKYIKEKDLQIKKINFYYKRYMVTKSQNDYLELTKLINECLSLINYVTSSLEIELPKPEQYNRVNRRYVDGFFSVRVVD